MQEISHRLALFLAGFCPERRKSAPLRSRKSCTGAVLLLLQMNMNCKRDCLFEAKHVPVVRALCRGALAQEEPQTPNGVHARVDRINEACIAAAGGAQKDMSVPRTTVGVRILGYCDRVA